MGILDRMFRERLEHYNGRVRFGGGTWVFKPTKRDLEKTGKRAIWRRDADGRSMMLVGRRGVNCPNPEIGKDSPRNKSKHSETWFVLATICRRCQHYRKGGLDHLKYPHCAWARAKRGGSKEAVQSVCETLGEAIDTANKMMGQGGGS